MSAGEHDPRALYEAMAPDYAADEANPYNALYERPATLRLLGPLAGRRVLDAGCGAGALSARMSEAGASVTGFDLSPAMIAIARSRAIPRAQFRVADLAAPLDFAPAGAFDLAVASLALHYLHDWVPALRELRRTLIADGALVISTHHPAHDVGLSARRDYHAVELVHDRWVKGGRAFDVTFWRRPLRAMFDAFAEAGLRVERLDEPLPDLRMRTSDPQAWARLSSAPWFVFFRLRPA